MKGHTKWTTKFLQPVLIGIGLSAVITVAGLALVAMLIMNQHMDPSSAKVAIPAIHFSTMLGGCFIGGKVCNENKLGVCITITAVIYLLCFAVTVLLSGGIFQGVIPCVLSGIAGGALALWLASRTKKRSATHIRKRRYR